jgi:ABC-type dipeptide/oligopeptide/nickel transport system permease component
MLRRYLAKRLAVALPSLLIASLIVFTLPRLIPGDVVAMMMEEKAYAKDLDRSSQPPPEVSPHHCGENCEVWAHICSQE